jgi:Flp pilus assembly protein TadD
LASLRFRSAARTALLAAVALMPAIAVTGAWAQGSLSTPQVTAEPTEAQQIETLVRQQRYDDALKRADAVLAKNPRNLQVRFLRAVIYSDTGKTAEATAAFEAMTQEFPELPEPYNNLAVLHAAAGRYDTARALLLRAIDVAPNYVTAQENLGDLHLAIAADVYARALKLDPNNAALKAKLQLARDASSKLRSAR